MLQIDIQSVPPGVIIRCSGRLILGVEAETLRCMVTSRPESTVAIDLSEVHCLDAAGLGLLVELQCWTLERSISLKIANPSSEVYRLIVLTGLDRVLPIVGRPADSGIPNPADQWHSMTA
jgi:anti-anti-sigma factor